MLGRLLMRKMQLHARFCDANHGYFGRTHTRTGEGSVCNHWLATCHAYVSVDEALFVMVGSSVYPSYWPTTMSLARNGSTLCNAFTFSCRMCAAENESGCSMATSARICIK